MRVYDNPNDPMYDDIAEGRDDSMAFQNPGSALRRASRTNPRNRPCPNCGEKNRLTPKDVALGYQCDACAERDERGW